MLHYLVAVCDDEPFAADAIAAAAKHELERAGVSAEFEVFSNARDLAQRVVQVSFDLILLDIELPGIDGIELGGMLRDCGVGTEIIYVSNSEGRVFESLEVRPLGFVRKSSFARDMANAMDVFVRAKRKKQTKNTISLKAHHAFVTFDVDSIRFIEAHGHRKTLHMVNGRSEDVTATLDELAEKLAPFGFHRVHKGYIVNFAHVNLIDAEGVHLGDDLVPVNRANIVEVRRAYKNYLQAKDSVIL